MYSKRIGLLFCFFFLLSPVLSQGVPYSNSEIEIDIYAGYLGNDIGFGITINVKNNKTEQISVITNISFDYLFRDHWDNTYSGEISFSPNSTMGMHISTGWNGIKRISIQVKADNVTVSRQGIAISKIMIFTD